MLTLTTSLLLGLSFTAGGGGLAGSPEVSFESYQELAEPFEAVGALGGMGTGTLIAEQWVLTAAHVADFLRLQGHDPMVFELSDGREFEVDRVIIFPRWKPLEQQMAKQGDDDLFTPGDLALMRLAEPVEGVEPMPLGEFDQSNPEVMLVGIGAFFNDPTQGADMRDVMGMERGLKHAGTNRVDRVDAKRDELIMSFTPPGDEGATEHEVSAFAGDSGGPILSMTDQGWNVIGVMAAVDSKNDLLGDYGDETHATSIGAVREWIDEQMAQDD